MSNWDPNLIQDVIDLSRHASEFIKGEFGKVSKDEIQIKDLNSLVSYVDVETEKTLVERLSQLVPEAGFLTEEGTREPDQNKLRWIVDPLDGTTNFLKGIPIFSISIGLVDGDDVLLGVVHDVMHDWTYWAENGKGAFRNGQRIHVSQEPDFGNSMIATGFPYSTYVEDSPMFRVLVDVIRQARGVRRLGSAAIDLAHVAAGVYEGYYEMKLNPWDLAAGILLVEEAGGKVSDFYGNKNMLGLGSIIAGNPLSQEKILSIVHAREVIQGI